MIIIVQPVRFMLRLMKLRIQGSEHLRYPYLECIKIGMSRDYLENCVKVSFPTSQDMFYDAYPSTESDGAKTRTKEDFSARLLAGDYDSLQKLYIDFILLKRLSIGKYRQGIKLRH